MLEYLADKILVGDESPEMPSVLFTLEHDERLIGLPSFRNGYREGFRTYRAADGVHSWFLLSR